LTQLPEGIERKLVAGVLLSSSTGSESSGADLSQRSDLLGYLRRVGLKREAEQLQEKINQSQATGDLSQLQQLLSEKMDITRKLHIEER
jgi:hypothetical protein